MHIQKNIFICVYFRGRATQQILIIIIFKSMHDLLLSSLSLCSIATTTHPPTTLHLHSLNVVNREYRAILLIEIDKFCFAILSKIESLELKYSSSSSPPSPLSLNEFFYSRNVQGGHIVVFLLLSLFRMYMVRMVKQKT